MVTIFTVDISEQELGRFRVPVVAVTESEGLLVGVDRGTPARRHVRVPVRVPVHQLYQTSLVLVTQEVLPTRLTMKTSVAPKMYQRHPCSYCTERTVN